MTQASNPARIGKELVRFATLDNDLLTLTSPNESFGRAILTWRKNCMKLLMAYLVCLTFSTMAHSQPDIMQLTKVKISFMEALAPKDTTSSERFQKEYEYAVQTGKDLTREKLKSCGYEITEEKVLYDASDNLQAFELAKSLRLLSVAYN